MRYLGLLAVLMLSGCINTYNPLTQIHDEPEPAFAPLSQVLDWHVNSCRHNAIEFSDQYRSQRQIQLFFESLCNTKRAEHRQRQITRFMKSHAWPNEYLTYFTILDIHENKSLALQKHISQLQQKSDSLKEKLMQKELDLKNLKSQLADIQKHKLDSVITPMNSDKE